MVTELDARAREVLRRLAELERRVAALESTPSRRETGGSAESPAQVQPAAGAAGPSAMPGSEVAGAALRRRSAGADAAVDLLPLIGRTLFILAGAFLLRAVTGSGWLPPTAGSAAGILYAGIWILLADRHAGGGVRTSASLYGLAAAGIAFPLLWEATASFGFLSPLPAAAALAAIAAGGFVVATRHRLAVLAAAYTVGAAATALALALATKLWPLFVGEVLVLTVALMALPSRRRWPLLEWLLGAGSAGALLLMTATWTSSPPERVALLFGAGQLLGLQLGWVLAVLGALAWRTLWGGSGIGVAEVVQGMTALAVGFGGALVVTSAPEVGTAAVGWVGLVLAGGCYAASFAVADRRTARRDFVFYSSVALLVTLIASTSLLAGPRLSAVLALAGALIAGVGWLRRRATLTLHAAVYIAAAAWTAGLARASLHALVGADLPEPAWIDAEVLLVLATAAAASWLPVATHGRTWGRYSRLPKVLLELVLLAGVAAVLVTLVAAATLRAVEGAGHLAALDALRSGVIAAIAILVAWLGRSPRWPEAAWMVYPILGVGAAKLVLVDLPEGTALSLVFSLLFYGAALVVVPRFDHSEGS